MMLSYRSKLLLNFTLLFAAFTLLLVGFQYNRERQYRRELLEARLLSYADLVAGCSGLNTTFRWRMPRLRSSFRMTRASGQPLV